MLELVALLTSLVLENAPLVLFLAAFLENAALLSIVAPGETLVAVGGYLVQQGQLRLDVAWASVFFGVLLGDSVAFAIGRLGGRPLIERLPFRAALRRVESLISRYGGWVVLLGRFSGWLRPVVMLTAGSMGLSWRRFWLFEIVGAAAWSAWWLTLGGLGGLVLEQLSVNSSVLYRLAVGILLASVVGLLLYRDRLEAWCTSRLGASHRS